MTTDAALWTFSTTEKILSFTIHICFIKIRLKMDDNNDNAECILYKWYRLIAGRGLQSAETLSIKAPKYCLIDKQTIQPKQQILENYWLISCHKKIKYTAAQNVDDKQMLTQLKYLQILWFYY